MLNAKSLANTEAVVSASAVAGNLDRVLEIISEDGNKQKMFLHL